MGRRKSKTAAKAAQAQPAKPPPPERPSLAPRVALTLLLAAAAPFETGPLGFLPPTVRLPLAAGVVALAWLPRAWPRAFEAGGLAVVLGTWFLLKVVGIHASNTDDNIYFYMADRLAHGVLPYRDFFFAHPPVHLVVPALVFRLTGFSIVVAKCIPVLAQTAAALFIYLAARPASRGMALAALTFHLGAYQVLMGSTDMDGENIMTMFLMASVLASVRRRPLLGGVMAGLALGTGLYALAGVLAVAVASLATGRRVLARYLIGLVACFGGMCVLCAALAGPGFVQGVFLYHLAKAPDAGRVSAFGSANPLKIVNALWQNLGSYLGSQAFGRLFFYHCPQFLGAAVALLWLARDAAVDRARVILGDSLSGSPAGMAKLGLLAAILGLAQWSGTNETYDFYNVPTMAFLAIPAGYGALRTITALLERPPRVALGWPLAAAGLFAIHVLVARSMSGSLWPDERARAGSVVRYEWRPPDAFGAVAEVTRRLLFEELRVRGEIEPAWRHFMWNKSLSFSTVDDIAAEVRANTSPDETIVGASTLTPLVALLAGRRIAADEIDTNNKRFKAGMIGDWELFHRVCADKVRYVLGYDRSHFSSRWVDASPTMRRWFQRVRSFDDPEMQHSRAAELVLYRRADGGEPPAGKVCEAEE